MAKKALVIGIDKYAVRPLSNCVNDATEVGEVLALAEYGFEVKTLIDEQATRRALLSELNSLFREDNEFILIYFSGHGSATRLGTFLVTVDSDSIDVGIDLEYIRKLLVTGLQEGATAVVILDCCHSGAANARALVDGLEAHDMNSRDVNRALPTLGNGRVVLAACQSHELAFELPSLAHGVFTYYLLEGLYGSASDSEGEITIPNLYDHVSRNFERITGQTPVFKGDIVGRIVLGHGLTPQTRAAIPANEAIALEHQAQQMMNEYIQETSTDIESWKMSTYRDACSSLSPKINWFDRKLSKYPNLVQRPLFNAAYATARSKLADLGHLMDGLETKIGTVEQKIGSGTFGTVWQIRTDSGGYVAYKVYNPIDLDNLEKVTRFKRGYLAMEQLDHPHIVRVHTFTECPIGFVMDYIHGPNLRDFAATKPEPTEIMQQLLTIGETLQHAHSRKVVHRDVKPENIIMRWEDGRHRPYLTDFDLAWFSTATVVTNLGLGSLIYAAPEQLSKPRAQVAHEPTTDVYAFGQLLFFMLCRRDPVPVLANNTKALSEEVRSWGYAEPAEKIVALYESCTRYDAASRTQDFRLICDQLYEIQQLLTDIDHTRHIDFDAFARQLAFSVVGQSPERLLKEPTSFYSSSGAIHIRISADQPTARRTEIKMRLLAQEAPVLQGADNYKDARDIINQRIDAAIRHYSARRRPGHQSPFETFIIMENVSLNIDGVENCRQVLTRVIDCIERR